MDQDDLRAGVIDTSRPHPARIYDYLLGGENHYAADRLAGEELLAAAPEARAGVRANRAFMERAVRYAVGAGVRQVLDIGTGLPTSPNVHEIAESVAPGVRVAYVDNDPIVKAHGDALLSRTGSTGIVLGDVREPRSVLGHPEVRRLIDFDEPVVLLLVAVLHFLTDDDEPARVVAELRDALPAGSHLVLSHATGDFADRGEAEAGYSRKASASLNLRSKDRVESFFEGFELVEPGLAQISYWRPDSPPPAEAAKIGFYGGVARLP
ncbi:SAM-dependent methyltransferase [Streptomyces sp. VRA16 Mangrove soil]|uniref:SAM-dependent methyltransferase n=1 Tax=Streptomyces sp. VRA16 Mangrove soil TaxID=2817434 RepID=UPI001E3BC4C9|nr:SAM-dependent methyltransferase [Streptomyces sp. VRA16 Mangrove soil]